MFVAACWWCIAFNEYVGCIHLLLPDLHHIRIRLDFDRDGVSIGMNSRRTRRRRAPYVYCTYLEGTMIIPSVPLTCGRED